MIAVCVQAFGTTEVAAKKSVKKVEIGRRVEAAKTELEGAFDGELEEDE